MLYVLGLYSLDQPSQKAIACRDKGLMWPARSRLEDIK